MLELEKYHGILAGCRPALLPGLGNLAGGMVAEFVRTTPKLLNLALHAASGIVIGVVAIELIPEALDNLAVGGGSLHRLRQVA